MATKFITVPIELMHDKQLSANQKFILAEIMQLCSLEKGCIASNMHFSELVGITTMGVSKALHDLEEKGYIKIDNAQTKRNFGREITINSGKSPINSGKSPINSGLESKENKTINKTIHIPLLDLFLLEEPTLGESGKKIIIDFIDYRKQIKSPIKTIAPIKLYIKTLRELQKLGYKIQEVIDLQKSKEWQSIKVEWVVKELGKKEDTSLLPTRNIGGYSF